MWFISAVLLVAASWYTIDGAEIGKAVATTGKPTPAECGRSTIPISKDKVVGVEAAIGNFPWQVTTFQKDSDSGKWRPACRGTLISTRAVLTVAHCLKHSLPGDLNVALGKTSMDYYRPEPTEVKRGVKKIHIHGLYSTNKSRIPANDIAILILDAEVEVTPSTMPACLDLQNIYGTHNGDITESFMTSYGDPDICAGACELTYSRASTQDYNACNKIANSTHRYIAALITPDKFCGDHVVYSGDSGAGLTFVFDNSHYLYGIACSKFSGSVDGKEQKHTIFINATHHIDWIRSHLS